MPLSKIANLSFPVSQRFEKTGCCLMLFFSHKNVLLRMDNYSALQKIPKKRLSRKGSAQGKRPSGRFFLFIAALFTEENIKNPSSCSLEKNLNYTSVVCCPTGFVSLFA